MADPTLYLFDGHNLLHAGGFADAAQCRRARELRRAPRRRRRRRLRRGRPRPRGRAARRAFRAARRHGARAARRRASRPRGRLPRLLRCRRARESRGKRCGSSRPPPSSPSWNGRRTRTRRRAVSAIGSTPRCASSSSGFDAARLEAPRRIRDDRGSAHRHWRQRGAGTQRRGCRTAPFASPWRRSSASARRSSRS